MVLLKFLSWRETAGETSGASSGTGVSRAVFLREAEILRSVNHPSIPRVLDVATDASHCYIATEWVPPGVSLGEILTRGRSPMLPPTIIELGLHIAGALAACHKAGVVHRDVSPANVVLGDERSALVDFGYAKLQNGDPLEPVWQSLRAKGVYGTPGFVAPEVVSRQSTGTQRSDVWSLCAVLYTAFTRSYPFQYYTDKQRAHLDPYLPRNAAMMAVGDEAVPAEIVEVLRDGLRANPAERALSAADIAKTLLELR
jgi:serine/threonine protein kinase